MGEGEGGEEGGQEVEGGGRVGDEDDLLGGARGEVGEEGVEDAEFGRGAVVAEEGEGEFGDEGGGEGGGVAVFESGGGG